MPFDDVKSGKLALTHEQINDLLHHDISVRVTELHPYWDDLPMNQRVAITSVYFNAPKIVSHGTKFKHYMDQHYSSNLADNHDTAEQYLRYAAWELKFNSNKLDCQDGLKFRRYAESKVFTELAIRREDVPK